MHVYPSWPDGSRERSEPECPTIVQELPFPNRGISASTELLKEYYRPGTDLGYHFAYALNAATPDIPIFYLYSAYSTLGIPSYSK